jgi:hypothetical protein
VQLLEEPTEIAYEQEITYELQKRAMSAIEAAFQVTFRAMDAVFPP